MGKRNKDTERALREEFEQKSEKKRREMKEENLSRQRETSWKRELGAVQAETPRKRLKELERRAEERESSE